MVLALFGPSIDLHSGGADLAFPHHACEAALAETATGVRPLARAWLRAGTVGVDGVKMAKSTGNLVLVDDLLRDYPPAAIRLLCLNRRWAQPWSYARTDLDRAAADLDALYVAGGSAVLGRRLGRSAGRAARRPRRPPCAGHCPSRRRQAARTLIEILALS